MSNWLSVKILKDAKYFILAIAFFENILLGILLSFLLRTGNSIGQILLISIFISLYFFLAWILPLMIFLRIPVKVRFNDSELILQNGIKREWRIQRGQIIKVVPMRALITKDMIYMLYYNRKKTRYGTSFDEESGRHVWEWYYGKKKDAEEKIDHDPRH